MSSRYFEACTMSSSCSGHCSWCGCRAVGGLCHGPPCGCDPSKGTPDYVLKSEEAKRPKLIPQLPKEEQMTFETSMILLGYAVLFGYASRGNEGIKEFVKFYVGVETNAMGSEFAQYATEEQGKAALYKCSTTGY